ncbi:TRAP transporter small permease [Candidatus Latescibacterota bacterium]
MSGSTESGAASLLRRFEDGLLIGLMMALLVLSFSQILLRNLADIGFLWLEPLIRHLVMWTGFLGALVATREHKHIRIDAALRLLPAGRQTWALLVADLVSAGVCGLLCWIAVDFVGDERQYGLRPFLDLPAWILQLVFPLTFGLMACRYGVRTARRVAGLRRGQAS